MEEENFGGYSDSDHESIGVSILPDSCDTNANSRRVMAIRAGKSVDTVELEVENTLFPDVFSNSAFSHVVPAVPTISTMLSSVSLKRKSCDDLEEDTGHVGKRVKEIGSEEKRLATGGLKCRIPVIISWFDRDKIHRSKLINTLLDTGAEIIIFNTRLVIDQLMPWRHRIKPL